MALVADCIDSLLINNRKNVSPGRAAAFAKRLIILSISLSTECILLILAVLRRLIIVSIRYHYFFENIKINSVKSQPSLRSIIDEENEVTGGVYYPDGGDPDHVDLLSVCLTEELHFLSKVSISCFF